jgi:putative transposase
MLLTYRYRVKSLQGELNRQARAVNYVWNYCNDAQRHAVRWGKRWPSGFDLNKLTAGSGRELALSATTIEHVGQQYARSRAQHRRPWLRYRGKKSLGWIPLRGNSLKWVPDGLRFAGNLYRVFKSRELPVGFKIKDGSSFSQDARGRWYLNLVVEIADVEMRPVRRAVGIDLGLKELAAFSTGETIGAPRHFRRLEVALGKAQRAGKRRQATNIHARIQNARRDFLHKHSTRIVREFDFIAVGNVNAAKLAKTSMAKSVLDAGWSTLRNQLRYKAIGRGAVYEEVSEYLTSQTCSSCGCLPPERPQGIAGLGIREWTCSDCGAHHNRDANAARNILLRSRHRPPVEGAMAA